MESDGSDVVLALSLTLKRLEFSASWFGCPEPSGKKSRLLHGPLPYSPLLQVEDRGGQTSEGSNLLECLAQSTF